MRMVHEIDFYFEPYTDNCLSVSLQKTETF